LAATGLPVVKEKARFGGPFLVATIDNPAAPGEDGIGWLGAIMTSRPTLRIRYPPLRSQVVSSLGSAIEGSPSCIAESRADITFWS